MYQELNRFKCHAGSGSRSHRDKESKMSYVHNPKQILESYRTNPKISSLVDFLAKHMKDNDLSVEEMSEVLMLAVVEFSMPGCLKGPLADTIVQAAFKNANPN